VPVNLNDTVGRHWSVKDKKLKSVTDVLAVQAAVSGVPKVTAAAPEVRRVSAAFTGWPDPRRRLPDPDNLMKYFLDAMVAAGLLVDDAADWCQWDRPTVQRGNPVVGIIRIAVLDVRPPLAELPHTARLRGAFTRKMRRELDKHTRKHKGK
jgi:hypothetical protein